MDNIGAALALQKGKLPEPERNVVKRDSSLQSCPAPSAEMQRAMLQQMEDAGVVHPSARLLPKTEAGLDQVGACFLVLWHLFASPLWLT